MTVMRARRFTLLDGMLLVASLALALTCWKAVGPHMCAPYRAGWGRFLTATPSFVLPLTLMLVPLGLLAPRPPWRRLWRSPGWNVGVAIVIALPVCVMRDAPLIVSWMRRPSGSYSEWESEYQLISILLEYPWVATSTVAAAWAILALSRRWRSDRSWVDRLGTVYGVYWIAHPFLIWLAASLP
jgi:hypothetical protein